MAIDKTKIHCPRCGCEYEIDPGIYSNRESIECVCGRKWRANPELEELCTKKLKPYSRSNAAVSVIFYLLLPSIVALLFWIKYHYQTKILVFRFRYSLNHHHKKLLKQQKLKSYLKINKKNSRGFIASAFLYFHNFYSLYH